MEANAVMCLFFRLALSLRRYSHRDSVRGPIYRILRVLARDEWQQDEEEEGSLELVIINY